MHSNSICVILRLRLCYLGWLFILLNHIIALLYNIKIFFRFIFEHLHSLDQFLNLIVENFLLILKLFLKIIIFLAKFFASSLILITVIAMLNLISWSPLRWWSIYLSIGGIDQRILCLVISRIWIVRRRPLLNLVRFIWLLLLLRILRNLLWS